MSVRTQILRLQAARESIASAITEKGVSVPSGTKLDGFAALISAIESGGGLPDGVSALASNTVTPAEDKTSTQEITHNLGVKPNFLVWWDTADYSTAAGTSLAYLGVVIEKQIKGSASSTTVNNHHFSVHGFNSNGAAGQTGSRAVNTSRMTATTAALVVNSTYPIKAGHTYRWVCGVMA